MLPPKTALRASSPSGINKNKKSERKLRYGKLYEGKSKIVYSSEEPGTCIIKYKDTATAGNGVKKEDLPGKGKLNAEISNIIFDYLMKNGVKTHLIKVIDETTVLAKKRRSSWSRS